MRLKENLWFRGMPPWKTSRKMSWNVQSLANCFIYGYWTLLLCQILNLFGAVDFLIKIVLLNCYLVQFAMIIPSTIFTFALWICVWSCKSRPVCGERARFQSCFLKGTVDFLWVDSLLSSILLFCFTSQAALRWLQTLSLPVINVKLTSFK